MEENKHDLKRKRATFIETDIMVLTELLKEHSGVLNDKKTSAKSQGVKAAVNIQLFHLKESFLIHFIILDMENHLTSLQLLADRWHKDHPRAPDEIPQHEATFEEGIVS